MSIQSSLPTHIARAYALPINRGQPAEKNGAISPQSPAQPAGKVGATRETSEVGADSLVAGRVRGGVTFDSARPAGMPEDANAGVLPLYTRAADRIEAAVAIHLGKKVDIKG